MSDITIPAAAQIAAENEVAAMLYGHSFSELSGAKQDVCKNIARACTLRVLENWPGMERQAGRSAYNPFVKSYRLILPLPPQENPND